MRATFVPALLVVLLFPLSGRTAEPTAEEVWHLVRSATALYEPLDGLDYNIHVKSPEIEALLASKGGGLVGTPDVRFIRRNLSNQITISLPDTPELFRAKAEERVEQEAGKLDAFKVMRELGWTLFTGFLRTVDAGGRYDVIEWNNDTALVEFNELSEPMMSRAMRSCRIRFDRRRSTILQTSLWFGGSTTMVIDATYDTDAFFPGTHVPLFKSFRANQSGFTGPAVVSFIMLDGKYERSATTRADDTSTSQRALLRRAGLSSHQIDRARVDADGNISLDFSNAPLGALSALQGLPVTGLNLTRTGIADLAPLKGLPLRSLILDQCPVEDLTPLLGMQIESLSLRNIRAVDLHVVAQFPLKKLNLGGTNGDFDLSLLKGLKLEELDLGGRPVADLRPLQGMPLRELVLRWSKVSDLGPLKGMPIKRLECSGSPLADLTPLAQCQTLEDLNVSGTRVEDLRPLAGLKLVKLRVSDTHVQDFSPLRGMPLRMLIAHNCPATDVGPLAECRELEQLTLPRSARNVGSLRDLPAMREVSFRWDMSREGPAETAEVFWKAFDTGAIHLSDAILATLEASLRAAGLNTRPSQTEDGTISLVLDGKPVQDLSILSGYPITVLSLRGTKVRDLKSLQGMLLKRLAIDGTQIADLSPLTGMPLESLTMAGTPVTDLAPLGDMPLKRLSLAMCPNLGDLRALTTITTLESVVLPPEAREYGFLRAATTLRDLSFFPDPSGTRAAQSVEAFWAEEARAPGQAQERARETVQKKTLPPSGAAGPH